MVPIGGILDFEKQIPELSSEAKLAVEHRGGHIQIIASAGSGKTETVSQRIARLIEEGVHPSEIVAFTFTTRAADELKERVRARVISFAGAEKADQLGTMYVGTIHGYCFQMLQRNVPKYESYSVLDDKQQTAFMLRYERKLQLAQFQFRKGKFSAIRRFKNNLEVLENELLDIGVMAEEFQESAREFYQLLDDHKFLTYGRQISEAVRSLEDPKVRGSVVANLKHLIVDEYQDVNPAQEKLISLLVGDGGVDLVVVGDDDQAIYQWRGSSVENIVRFQERYPNVTSYRLLTNRRSRPEIVKLANEFAKSIPGRLDKEMLPAREANGPSVDMAISETEASEAADIAATIRKLVSRGYEYKQMAVLVRGRAAYKEILEAFKVYRIPVLPGDREGLFDKEDADFLGRCFVWLVDYDWKTSIYSTDLHKVELADLLSTAGGLYSLSENELLTLRNILKGMKAKVGTDSRKISLIKFAYDLTDALGLKNWDSSDPLTSARLGTVSKVIGFIADYEAMAKSARVSRDEEGVQTGVPDEGEWYFKNLAVLLTGYAIGEYRDFEGESDDNSNAVDLLTVHSAKGLEWPIVFIPSLTAKRFPSGKAGQEPQEGPWLVPTDLFDFQRYQGTEPDERRLFYVALTRAREWVALSSHEKVSVQKSRISPFYEFTQKIQGSNLDFPAPWSGGEPETDSELHITYSELADYLNCGMSFWLRNRLGFPPAILEEIGYGRAVHHLMRAIADATAEKGRPLTPNDVDRLLATDFFLPFAGKLLHSKFKDSARKLVFNYLSEHAEELSRVWESERPFELALPGVVVSGRADVVLDKHDGKVDSLSIVDYKTQTFDEEKSSAVDFELQLQVYSEAGIREGLDVSAAFVHALEDGTRTAVPIDESSRAKAIEVVIQASKDIKARKFDASPNPHKCGICDVRSLCRSAAPKP